MRSEPFKRLLDSLPVAVYTCDAEGRITDYNEHAIRLWGRAPNLHDAEERYCGSFRLHLPDGRTVPHADCWMARALRENRAYEGHEIIVERPDGSRRCVLAHATPIRDDTGKLTGAINVLLDITAHREAQEALRESGERLRSVIDVEGRRKDDFLATLGHELRNPLTPLRAELDIMRMTNFDPATVKESHALIERQVEHLTRLVGDLLDLSRVSHGLLRVEKAPTAIEAVVEAAIEATRGFILAASHELDVELPNEPVELVADAFRLSEVLTNLLTNAAKYTPPGGKIALRVEADDNEVRISVRDTGIGIPQDRLDSIFEMFGQVDRSLEKGYRGLGIGLSIAKALVEMHGGTIAARSGGPQNGSEFLVRLPRAPAGAAPSIVQGADAGPTATATGNAAPGSPAVTPRRVLLVDDNDDVVRALSRLVRLLGHDVHVAVDGEQAVAAAATYRPDLVLMDIGLPRLNGYAAARRIRDQAWGRRMKLVAMTGWGQEHDKQRSRDAGFDRHLTKPVELDVLRDLLALPQAGLEPFS